MRKLIHSPDNVVPDRESVSNVQTSLTKIARDIRLIATYSLASVALVVTPVNTAYAQQASATPSLQNGQHAPNDTQTTESENDQEPQSSLESDVELVEVTGSRIKRNALEGVSPITLISSEDIVSQGHATVFDALNSLSINTGIFVGEENSNNFNANAQALNLRGFGPGYTLVLINGRRVPVLPKPSGAVAGNVVNLAMIPTEAIERIEILSGGASAIYGSDAVAGVVNIILKKTLDGPLAKYRYGDTKDGGGRSHLVNLATGGEIGGASFIAGLELNLADPIRGGDRDWFDEPSDNPDPTRRNLSQVMSYWSRFTPNPFMLMDLTDECEAQGYTPQQPDWVIPFEGDPYFCGDNVFNTFTIRNERNRLSGFVHLDYEIDDDTDFNMDFIVTNSSADAGLFRYSYAVDYDVLDDNGDWLASRQMFRRFRDFETPTSNQEFEETSYTLISGISGLLNDTYDYNINLTLSRYDYEDSVSRFNDQAMLSLLFGEKGVDWEQPFEGSRWVTVNRSNVDDRLLPNNFDFFGDLSADMFSSALHESIGKGDSWTYNLSADIAGDIYELDAGNIQFAAVVEFINEGYEFITDEPTVNGEIWGWSGIVGEGERNHYAIGAELLVPILSEDSGFGELEGTAALRYDRYNDASSVGGATTYQLGLTWRPTEDVMIRASRATSFRAPDMHFLYAQRSSSFTSGIDFNRCISETNLQPGDNWLDCTDNYGTGSIRSFTEGDINLKEETGYSANIGIVADISDDWDFSLDFYQIKLEEQVGLIGTSTVLLFEAECIHGFNALGQAVDVNSPRCQEMLGRVTRGGRDGSVTGTRTSPFNTGLREQSGMDIASRYDWKNTGYGDFYISLKYTHIFETLVKFLPDDELEDIRDLPGNNEFRTRTNVTLGWQNNDYWTAIFINRLGTSPIEDPNFNAGRYPAWTRVNLSAGYKYDDSLSFSMSVNNLFDKRPHQHESERFWPFADVSKYNPVGMEYFVTAMYQF